MPKSLITRPPSSLTWCLPLLWASTSMTRSFVAACATGWGSPYTVLHTLVLSAGELLTHLEIIRLGVEEMETVCSAIMLSGMCSSVRLGPRLWLPLKTLLAWCLHGSSSRPADILLPTWSRGRPAALDVHIISPLQRQTVTEAASIPDLPTLPDFPG